MHKNLLPLSLALLAALGAAAAAQTTVEPDMAATMLTQLDTNGDGEIDPAEIAARKARQFARSDRNGDGQLDADETGRLFSQIHLVATMAESMAGLWLTRADKDGDGSISQVEFTSPSRMFALLDADDSGTLSAAEISRFKRLMAN